MKHPGGRPTKYRHFFCKDLIDYFSISPTRITTVTYTNKKGEQWTEEKTVANDLPTLSGFAGKIGVDDDTIQQ